MTRVAALPMYDLPELRAATDALWAAIADELRAAGETDVPEALVRDRPAGEILGDPTLLLAQTCGYPLVTRLSEKVRVVGVASHDAEGCGPGTYRSAVIVREDGGARRVVDLRGHRAAVNAFDSHSGMNALRALVSNLARGGRFFSAVSETGSHRGSIAAVREGRADVAAIDAVSWALIGDVAPEEREGLAVLAWTDEAPSLPYITGGPASDGTLVRLRSAIEAVMASPSLGEVRRRLRLVGFRPAEHDDFLPIAASEAMARSRGYPELA